MKTSSSFLVSALVAVAALCAVDFAFRTSRMSRRIDETTWIGGKRPHLEEARWDVVVAGSSVIHEGLRPSTATSRLAELTGKTLTIFNFGIGGGSFVSDGFAASAAVARPPSERPKYFVFSLGPMEFSGCTVQDGACRAQQEEVPSNVKWTTGIRVADVPGLVSGASSAEEAFADLTLGLFRLEAARQYVLPAVFDQQGIGGPAPFSANGGEGDKGAVDPRVQAERARSRAASYSRKMMKPAVLDRAVSGQFLRTQVHRLQAAGVQVAFMNAPQASALDANDGPESIYPEYLEFVTQLAKELHVPFEDMRHIRGITDNDFVDGDHLNRDGAVKFSKALAEAVLAPMIGNATDDERVASVGRL